MQARLQEQVDSPTQGVAALANALKAMTEERDEARQGRDEDAKAKMVVMAEKAALRNKVQSLEEGLQQAKNDRNQDMENYKKYALKQMRESKEK